METCAGCGKPIEMGQGSYYSRLPFGGEFGRTYHSECGDPLGIKKLNARIAELEAVLRHIARISTQDCSKGGVFTIFLEIEKMARGVLAETSVSDGAAARAGGDPPVTYVKP